MGASNIYAGITANEKIKIKRTETCTNKVQAIKRTNVLT
jgi:hypothetical protein